MAFSFSTSPVLDPESFNKSIELLQQVLMESITTELTKAKATAVTVVKNDISDLSRQIAALHRDLYEIKTQLASLQSQPRPTAVMDRDSSVRVNRQSDSIEKRNQQVVKRRFYAKYSPTQNILMELPDNVADKAAFIAEVSGEEGTVSYNPKCTPHALSALSSAIYQFFDYDLKSDTPTVIEPQNSVKIRHLSGKNWQMDGRISLIIK